MSCDMTYKDQDFASVIGNINIENASQIKSMINKDVQLLLDCKIMDYSLFIVVLTRPSKKPRRCEFKDITNNRSYSIGIIDFLQTYDITKKVEHVGKSLARLTTSRDEISAVNEETYASRFRDKIEEILT